MASAGKKDNGFSKNINNRFITGNAAPFSAYFVLIKVFYILPPNNKISKKLI